MHVLVRHSLVYAEDVIEYMTILPNGVKVCLSLLKKRVVSSFAGRHHSEETKQIISQKKNGIKRPDVAERNRLLKRKTLTLLTKEDNEV